MRSAFLSALAIAIAGFSGAAQASEVIERITSGSISFGGGVGMYNGTMTVAGPDDYYDQFMNENGLPTFTLQEAGKLEDGVYSYTLTAATAERQKIKRAQNNGRGDAAQDTMAVPFSTSGMFLIKNGVIAELDTSVTEESLTDDQQ